MSDEDTWPIAIDPPGCGCTECIVGQYVPLDRATSEQVVDMLLGKLHNNLGDWENEHMQLEVAMAFGEYRRELPPEQAARLIKQRALRTAP